MQLKRDWMTRPALALLSGFFVGLITLNDPAFDFPACAPGISPEH